MFSCCLFGWLCLCVIVGYMTATPLAPIDGVSLRIADEGYLATAQLHRDYPQRGDFFNHEIESKVRDMFGDERAGVKMHISQHCVANKPPSPSVLRMLYEPAPRRRRLFRAGDTAHALRTGPSVPDATRLPAQHLDLLEWASERFESDQAGSVQPAIAVRFGALLEMAGSGRQLWSDEHADSYVNRLREGW